MSPSGPDAKGLIGLFESGWGNPVTIPAYCTDLQGGVAGNSKGKGGGQNPKCTQKGLRGTVVIDIIDHLGDALGCVNQSLVSYTVSGSKRVAHPSEAR